MKKSVFTTIIVASLLGSHAVLADMGGQGKFMRFFDTNNDGIVTLDEFNESAGARFARMDANNDDKLTKEEFRGYIKQRKSENRAKMLERMDTNKDSAVTEDEYVAYKSEKAKLKFVHMDKNVDGALSAEEMQDHGKHKHGKGKRIFKRMDKDGDGQVTRDESYAAWSAWFARVDANGDMVVTTDEVNAYRQMKREKHQI